MAVESGIVSHYLILVTGKFIDFYVAFQTYCVFCFFLVTIFLRRVCSTQHIAAYTKAERTAEDLVFWCKTK